MQSEVRFKFFLILIYFSNLFLIFLIIFSSKLVTWLPNLESGRPGSEFFVRYRKKGEEHFLSSSKRDTLDPVPIEGLSPGETYEFKIGKIFHNFRFLF